MKVLINQMPKLGKSSNIYAFGKARGDIDKIFKNNGNPVEYIICKFYKFPFLTSLRILCLYKRLLRKYQGESHEFFFQYQVSCEKVFPTVMRMLQKRGHKITLIIHDINSFRYKQNTDKEIALLQQADRIIVHTQAMKELLEKNGVKTRMDILQLFDYLTDDSIKQLEDITSKKNEIIFAGNLAKSVFLGPLMKLKLSDISYNLYGNTGNKDFSGNVNIHYKGVFDGDHIGGIEGGWGLVWDGDAIDTCSGELGNYLKYNASHKLSLYIAAGIPVIVWNQSSEADYIKQNQLGIAVDSLEHLEEEIKAISEQEYEQMTTNCMNLAQVLRNGGMTEKVILQKD